ncbi:MAG: hypothetical protein QG597_3545 [Actinomycetota bacterium]|nr:hypothetical protein [Actinomycetota bacterium]
MADIYPADPDFPDAYPTAATDAARDIADVPAVEIITTVALHLMTASAVACGLGEGGEDEADLAEARILINALAALVVGAAPDLGTFHAGPLRDGLKTVQLAFREASAFPDPPGKGPGERFTGPVN